MLSGLLIIIAPLFIGYFVRITSRDISHTLNSLSLYLLYIMLLIMGLKLGVTENIMQEFLRIGKDFALITIVLHLCNFAVLMTYDLFHKRNIKSSADHIDVGNLFDKHLMLSIAKLLSMVVIGFVVGFFTNDYGLYVDYETLDHFSTTLLVILIFIVGMMLGNSPDVNLKMILLNREGLILSIIFSLSSLAGGVLLWLVWDYNLVKMLGISSGMGWYSLSSVVIARAWGPIDGSIALFVDLSRELAALILVPLLMKRFPATALTQPGATSLDCSLPIIQRSGGIGIVPLTLSFGFLVNMYTPILLVMFTGMPIN